MELNYSLCISFFFVWQLDRGWFNRFLSLAYAVVSKFAAKTKAECNTIKSITANTPPFISGLSEHGYKCRLFSFI